MKSDNRRAVILELLADHVLAAGISASSLRPLAKAAKVSDRMLLYYFADKAELIAATLERVSERLVVLLETRTARKPMPLDQLRQTLAVIVLADDLWPYMRLWLDVASLAAYGDPVFKTIGERIARGFLAWGEAQLASPTKAQQEIDAALLLVNIEGMVLLKSVGLGDVCARLG
jgi:AcrR family transcriptional regulator